MEKLFIENRKGEKISILVEKNDNQKGLAFVMHGLGGFVDLKNRTTLPLSPMRSKKKDLLLCVLIPQIRSAKVAENTRTQQSQITTKIWRM